MSVAKLLKQLSKMSEEEKAEIMEFMSKDETEEVGQDNKQVETQEPQPKEEDKKEVETQPEKKEQVSEVAKTTDDTNVEKTPQPQEQMQGQEQVYTEGDQAVGISINDVALKSDIQAKFDAFEAKLDSLVKENKDLKEQLSKSQDEAKDLHNKYERDDFGNQAERNFGKVNKANDYESADDYLKRFR